MVLNTGAPQGCVLSPTLFSIYTDHMRFQTALTSLLKFADDMALIGLLKEEDSLATYFSQISVLSSWCKDSFLEMNVGKTKELVIDNRQSEDSFVPVTLNNEPVEVVPAFKYLGTVIDNKLFLMNMSK